MNRDALIIDSICKTYKKGNVKANNNISLKIHPSEITALIGHNGAGKTTLLNQIVGNVRPDKGDISYNGISFVRNSKKAREVVSMMPQFHAPLEGVTLKQSVEAILRIKGASKKESQLYTEKILKYLDIEQWANRSGNNLSGGLQRLTSFAMAVAYPSDIILLDEPTNDIDPVRRKLVWQYMRKLAKNGHIIFVVTHNLLEVEQYTDRYILLNQGEVIRDSSTSAISKDFGLNMMTVIFRTMDDIQELPIHETCKIQEDQMQIIMILSEKQIPSAIDWVMTFIKQGKVLNYKLTSASLDVLYGGMVDEC